MRYLFIITFMFCSVIMYGQKITVNKSFRDVTLYNEDGTELSKEEVQDLSEYGFDVAKYNRLRVVRIVTDYCTMAGCLAGALLIPESEYKTLDYIFTMSVLFYLIDCYCGDWMEREVMGLNKRLGFGVTDSGVGLHLSF